MGARLGQHFLRDERVLDDILAAADLKPGQRVLEIGPGPGNLTERLLGRVGAKGTVVAIEADRALSTALVARKLAGLTVVHADAVQHDLASHGRFDRIVANLPYLISGPITAKFLDLCASPATRWDRAVLMYQKEFADRLLASPGTRDYGRLTVHAARWVSIRRVRDVAPGAFEPPPEVDSTVVTLEPHATPPFEVRHEKLWRAVVDGVFQQRRKKLRNTVPGAVAGLGIAKENALAAVERWKDVRPEELAPDDFAKLCAALVA